MTNRIVGSNLIWTATASCFSVTSAGLDWSDPGWTATVAAAFAKADTPSMGEPENDLVEGKAVPRTAQHFCPMCRKETTHQLRTGAFGCTECFLDLDSAT